MEQVLKIKLPKRCLLSFLVVLIIPAVLYSALRGNFHTVIQNQVYRSAQVSGEAIRHLVYTQKIKTIINLRGPHPEAPWYKAEKKVADAFNLHIYNIPLNSQILPSVEQLRELAEIIQHAPRPLLIHCLSGADRTGLVSAMTLILLQEASLKTAKKQFSWRYFVVSSKTVGRQVFSHYQKWLERDHKRNDKINFLHWLHLGHPYTL